MLTRSRNPLPGAGVLKRKAWAAPLRDHLFAQLGLPFVYGETDCHALSVHALDVMTGGDYFKIISGRYTDARSAIRLIRELGEFDQCVEARGGYEVPVAAFGDFVIYDNLTGVKWPHRIPAVAMGGGRVIVPVAGDAIALAPMYAIGRVKRVLRIPCHKL
jgi:hypothetical protein